MAVLMMFDEFGQLLFMLLCGGLSLIVMLALFLVSPFIVFGDSSLLGCVSSFLDFVFVARVYGFSLEGSPVILYMLLH